MTTRDVIKAVSGMTWLFKKDHVVAKAVGCRWAAAVEPHECSLGGELLIFWEVEMGRASVVNRLA